MEIQFKCPIIDNLISKSKQLGSNTLMFKDDLKGAFPNLCIDLADYKVIGTLFSFHQGASSCQLCADTITYLMWTINVWVMAYLDNIIGISPQ